MTTETIFNEETGFLLMDYTYPEETKGWINNIYYDRVQTIAPGATYDKVYSYFDKQSDARLGNTCRWEFN